MIVPQFGEQLTVTGTATVSPWGNGDAGTETVTTMGLCAKAEEQQRHNMTYEVRARKQLKRRDGVPITKEVISIALPP
jgi:hypothetical protein